MDINKEKTIEYYKTYIPCKCGDCKNYYNQIKKKYAEICEYLESLGIDPLKPFELISIENKENKIEYLDCMYVVFGTCEDEILSTVNGMDVMLRRKYHPDTLINDEHFVLTFGPVILYKNISFAYYGSHIPYEEKLDVINSALIKFDPIGLINMRCPKDEYIIEAKQILSILEEKGTESLSSEIKKIFFEMFTEKISKRTSKKISYEIISKLKFKSIVSLFKENELLKDVEELDNSLLRLIIHDGFIVTLNERNTYINGKYYYDIKTQDIERVYCVFYEDNETIYIQYKYPKLSLFKGLSYFEEVPKNKFELKKYIRRKNVECIFDNNKIIYNKKIN